MSTRFLPIILLSLLSTLASAQNTPPPRPNIIFILCDDLGYGDTGYLFQKLRQTANVRSEPYHFTPRLDTLAAEGLQLPHHYCPAPVCAPSRASLLLGVHQGHSNIRDNQFDKALDNNHTLPSVLKAAGYATACIGKWGLQGSLGNAAAPNWPAYPLARGFDFYHGYVRHTDGHAHYPKEDGKQIWEMTTNITSQCDKCYTTDLFTARSKKWISDQRTANPAQPFFLYLSFDTPHAELQLPTGPFPAGGVQWTGTPGALINTATGTVDSYYHPDYATAVWDDDSNPSTPEKAWPDVDKRYATDVRRIDDCVGDLMQTLKDLNIDNNTLIVFTTDNGPSRESYLPEAYNPNFFNSFGPFDGIKRDCLEGGIRVGAAVRWPGGIPAGRTSNLPCQMHDWLPTFAALAGVPAPARTDGVSLVPTLTGTGIQSTPQVYVEYFEGGTTPAYSEFLPAHRNRQRNQMQAIRSGDFMGVRYNIGSHSAPFEIYNVLSDPGQTTNLASTMASLQTSMKDTVLRIRRPDSSAARPYDAELIPAITAGAVTQGVNWRSFEGSWNYVPELTTLTETANGTSASPAPAVRSRDNDIGLLFTGYLQVPADGSWTFHLSADTRAFLRIHEAAVIDADKGYAPGSELSASIQLKAGRHPFRLYYTRQSSGTPAFSLKWSSTNVAKQSVPDSAFLRDGTGGANLPPSANADRVKTALNTPVTISPLENDSDDGPPAGLSLSSYTDPLSGSLVRTGNSLSYTPATGFLGTDSFSYTITDNDFASTGTVDITVGFSDNDFWFPFDEASGVTAEEAGGLKTATLLGFALTPTPWVEGNGGRGLNFDGTDDYVSVDNFNGIAGASPRSITAWIKTTSNDINRPIVAWGANSSGAKWDLMMTNTGQLRLEITGGFVVGTRVINDGSWHHVACVFSGTNVSEVKLYVDGALETLSSTSPLLVNTTTPANARIGSDVQARFWRGLLDEVHIYRRALTASEINTLANGLRLGAQVWQRRYFGNAPVDWTSDSDQDGTNELLEFALGREPHRAEQDPAFSFRVDQGEESNMKITFRRRIPLFGVSLVPQLSSDLASWSGAALTPQGSVADPASPDLETITFTFPPVDPRIFCRLLAVLQ